LAGVEIRKLEDDLLRVRGVDVDVEVVGGSCHNSGGADNQTVTAATANVGRCWTSDDRIGHLLTRAGMHDGKRWYPIVATVDRIVQDLVLVVVDMRRLQ
jgi:hypothetical protein